MQEEKLSVEGGTLQSVRSWGVSVQAPGSLGLFHKFSAGQLAMELTADT